MRFNLETAIIFVWVNYAIFLNLNIYSVATNMMNNMPDMSAMTANMSGGMGSGMSSGMSSGMGGGSMAGMSGGMMTMSPEMMKMMDDATFIYE